MEEAFNTPDLSSLEEMIADQRWCEPYLEDEPDDDLFLVPLVPRGFRPAA